MAPRDCWRFGGPEVSRSPKMKARRSFMACRAKLSCWMPRKWFCPWIKLVRKSQNSSETVNGGLYEDMAADTAIICPRVSSMASLRPREGRGYQAVAWAKVPLAGPPTWWRARPWLWRRFARLACAWLREQPLRSRDVPVSWLYASGGGVFPAAAKERCIELFNCTLGHRANACRGAPYTHLARMNVSCDTFG